MHTPVVQRWRDRRGSYRPAGETIRTRDYEVTPIETALARPVVLHLGQALPYPKFAVGERGGHVRPSRVRQRVRIVQALMPGAP